MPTTLLPDTVAIVADYLRQNTDVRAFVSSRVFTRIPPNPTYPLVRVTLIVESELVARRFAATRVQVEAFALTEETARDLAATCRAVLHDLPAWAHPRGWVSHVEEASGVASVPDTTVGRERFLFDARVYATPHYA